MRYMFAEHALGTLWMGDICALSAGTFLVFSVTHSRRTTHALKIDFFARASVVRRSCVSIRYWFVEGASLTLRIFLCAVEVACV